MGNATCVPLGWNHYTFNNVPQPDWLAVIRYYVNFFFKFPWQYWETLRGWQEGFVCFCCVHTLRDNSKVPLPKPITTAPSFFFLRHPLENTDVTGCWNQLPACGTPFRHSPPPLPLGTVEIQMTHLSIIRHRGCVLKPKPSLVSFGWRFIYDTPCQANLGTRQGLVSYPLRVCLGQPYGLLQALCVCGCWSHIWESTGSYVCPKGRIRPLVTQAHKPSTFLTQWSSHGILVRFWCTCESSIPSAMRSPLPYTSTSSPPSSSSRNTRGHFLPWVCPDALSWGQQPLSCGSVELSRNFDSLPQSSLVFLLDTAVL